VSAATDDVLGSEQQYLARAREDLEKMRQRTLALDAQAASALMEQYLSAALWHRAQALIDDPNTTLFFGRTDHTDGARWYIGRRHVADPAGDPVVIDWRADVARAFYRAGRADPLGVDRRRRFGVEHGKITAYEDEHLTDPVEAAGRSKILAHEIERPRSGPMRDIVATIQPEQDVLVRAGIEQSVCIQGAPGTGKTAVGLHRAAWLLYAHRDRLARTGVLVVGPNESFLEHVNAVLPSLGEAQVRHSTVESLVVTSAGGHETLLKVRGADPVDVTGLKGDSRMAEVLHRAVWSSIMPPTEAFVLPRGARKWRIPPYVLTEMLGELRERGVRYAAARDMLPQRIAHHVLVLMEEAGDSPDDRVQDAVARAREVKRFVDAVWPAVSPQALLFTLFTDPDALAAAAGGILTDDEQKLLLWAKAPRSAGSARWSAADAVLLDEIAGILRRPASLGHVVLDEAQDLSPMQLRAVGRRCSTGSMTVLGDIAQGTTPWATPSWEVTLDHLGHPEAVIDVLDQGFRVPAAVIDYAARLLPSIAPGLRPPTSVRDDPGSLTFSVVDDEKSLWARVLDAVRADLERPGSVGVIVPDGWVTTAARTLAGQGLTVAVLGGTHPPDDLDVRVSVVPATTAKGLEYDRVVVVEPTRIAQDEPDERTGLRRLYVVLTRAVTALTVIHSRPLPEQLR
jgi:DNA helicase IV